MFVPINRSRSDAEDDECCEDDSICHAYAKSTNDALGTEEPPKAATESERSLTLLTQNLLELQKEMIKT